jgi:hypothetical protein
MTQLILPSLALAVASCSVTRQEDDSGTTTSTSSSTTDTGDSSRTGASEGFDPPIDTGAADATAEGSGPPIGCTKADLLFVVDNSGSMADEQANLTASFGPFITAIQDTLDADDYHIMVVDTDTYPGKSEPIIECDGLACTCTPSPSCCEYACDLGAECNGGPCQPPDSCANLLGAGRITDANGQPCFAEATPRFMSDATDDLAGAFACIGEVGIGGSGNEQPMAAMLAAVGPLLATCNTGFLRDDAVLIVTFITDEDDADQSPGTPNEWAQELVAAKLGDPGAVVVLGLFGDSLQPDAICAVQEKNEDDGAEDGFYLRQFVGQFGDRALSGSVCAADYGPFFAEAIGIIDAACDAYVPPVG